MRKYFGLPLIVAVSLLVMAACSSADEATPAAMAEPTTAPAAPAATAATTAPAAQTRPQPTTPPAQKASAVLTASEVIQQSAEAMGVPLQLPQPPANYAPIRGGNVDLVTNGWPFPRYWDWLHQGAYSNMYISLWAETLVTFPQGPGTNPADYTRSLTSRKAGRSRTMAWSGPSSCARA